MIKCIKISFSVLLIFVFLSPSLALDKNAAARKLKFSKPTVANAYPDVNITWIGIGELTRYGITNTGQQGLWIKPTDWTGYDGTFPTGTFDDGDNAEWPAGTNQTYCYTASLWIGGEVPIVANGDTLFWEKRVDTGSYLCEWGTVSPLYTSNQVFPSSYPEAGSPIFKQKYREKESYQELWPYLDVSVNRRRPAEVQLDSANGDFVSDEDSYCEYGSFMSKDDAVWIDPSTTDYDTKPLGVHVYQRTYSWTSPIAEDAIVLDFIIENGNDFPIRNLYAGYFMDNDIGFADIDEPQGSNDDLIGFDPALSLGYTYDYDGYEKDWKTVAGYIGAVWLKGVARSPINDSYLTGFQTWTREGDESNTDARGFDILRYKQLDNEQTTDPNFPYEVFETPQDVRMLLCTGPNIRLNPGQTDTVTVAIVMGESLADLQQNTRNIQKMYDEGFIIPEAPPSPNLTAYPADQKVYLSWDDFPESIADPFTGEVDFEGYRVYKNETGLATDWNLLAEYDIYGTRTANSVITKITRGNTTARFYFKQFDTDTLRLRQFKGDQIYTINFTSENNFVVYNQSSGVLYSYDKKALSSTGLPNTFCVAAQVGNKWTPMPFSGTITTTDPNYNQPNLTFPPNPDPDSTIVYFDGMFFVIGTGPEDPAGLASRDPQVGHVLEISTIKGDVLGNETGLKYNFIDSDVRNGISYYYAVTSFDRGAASIGLSPLESSKKQNQIKVTPVTPPITGNDPGIVDMTYQGPVSGEVLLDVAQPAEITGHVYQVSFFDSLQPPYGNAKYWKIRDTNTGETLLDSMTNVFGTSADPNGVTPLVDGIYIDFEVPLTPIYDAVLSGWSTTNNDVFGIHTTEDMEPYDFEIQFPQFPDNVDTDINGLDIPYKVYNKELNEYHQTQYYDVNNDGVFNQGDSVGVIGMYTTSGIFSFVYLVKDPQNSLKAGDIYVLTTDKPFQVSNVVTFKTTGPSVRRTDVDMNQIKVVPNPYYIRAEWDLNKYSNHIMFTNLPDKCTINIFTLSGILIKQIEHDAYSGDPDAQGGSHNWNLQNKEQLKIASGLYIYQVKSDAGEIVGKFVVVR
jgi:hypothetical protein